MQEKYIKKNGRELQQMEPTKKFKTIIWIIKKGKAGTVCEYLSQLLAKNRLVVHFVPFLSRRRVHNVEVVQTFCNFSAMKSKRTTFKKFPY